MQKRRQLMWINLHTASEAELTELMQATLDCEEGGGDVVWLQSSTTVHSTDNKVGRPPFPIDITVTPITILTAILTWKER